MTSLIKASVVLRAKGIPSVHFSTKRRVEPLRHLNGVKETQRLPGAFYRYLLGKFYGRHRHNEHN